MLNKLNSLTNFYLHRPLTVLLATLRLLHNLLFMLMVPLVSHLCYASQELRIGNVTIDQETRNAFYTATRTHPVTSRRMLLTSASSEIIKEEPPLREVKLTPLKILRDESTFPYKGHFSKGNIFQKVKGKFTGNYPEPLTMGNYEIKVLGAALSQKDEDNSIYDYYHIALDGSFTPNAELTRVSKVKKLKPKQNRNRQGNSGLPSNENPPAILQEAEEKKIKYKPHPILVSDYGMSIVPMRLVGGQLEAVRADPRVIVYKHSNPTSEGKTEYSSSISLQLNGQIGGGYPAGANASLGPGIGITHSETRSIEDSVITYNDPGLKPTWSFELHNLQKNLKKPTRSHLGENNFSPYVQCIFRVKRRQAENSLYYQDNGDYYFLFTTEIEVGFKKALPNILFSKGENRAKARFYELPDLNKIIVIKVPPLPEIENYINQLSSVAINNLDGFNEALAQVPAQFKREVVKALLEKGVLNKIVSS